MSLDCFELMMFIKMHFQQLDRNSQVLTALGTVRQKLKPTKFGEKRELYMIGEKTVMPQDIRKNRSRIATVLAL